MPDCVSMRVPGAFNRQCLYLAVFIVVILLVIAVFFCKPIFFQEGNPLAVLSAIAALEFTGTNLVRIEGPDLKYIQKHGPEDPLNAYLSGLGWAWADRLGAAIFYKKEGQTLYVEARKLTRRYVVYQLDREPQQ